MERTTITTINMHYKCNIAKMKEFPFKKTNKKKRTKIVEVPLYPRTNTRFTSKETDTRTDTVRAAVDTFCREEKLALTQTYTAPELTPILTFAQKVLDGLAASVSVLSFDKHEETLAKAETLLNEKMSAKKQKTETQLSVLKVLHDDLVMANDQQRVLDRELQPFSFGEEDLNGLVDHFVTKDRLKDEKTFEKRESEKALRALDQNSVAINEVRLRLLSARKKLFAAAEKETRCFDELYSAFLSEDRSFVFRSS